MGMQTQNFGHPTKRQAAIDALMALDSDHDRAVALGWALNGDMSRVLDVAESALEDWNFHPEAAQVAKIGKT